MKIVDKILEKVECTRVNGGCTPSTERIVKETALTINIDGQHYATAMILASLEKEYVVGHLYAQGIIRRAADMQSITIINNTAEVTLTESIHKKPAPTKIASDLKVRQVDVFDSVRAILKSEIFTETEAVHSAGLFLHGKEPVCIAEDLGRHNALDKVIGYSLLHDVDFRQTLAASTGRQPTEMLVKCLNAGIPIIATKGVPTILAVEIAEKAGLTIAGLVRGSTMMVY